MIEIEEVNRHVTDFLTATMDNRILQERDRDYFDHKQWTADEVKALIGRGQAPIVNNRVKPKVEGLVGFYLMRNTDPKAFPRTKKHEKSAHAITDALRYVADNVDFLQTKTEVSETFFVEGYGGVIVDVAQAKNGEIEINVKEIPFDRIYFDPYSRKKDFSDARYIGMMMWMDEEEAHLMFPEANIAELIANSTVIDETFEDRPRWVDKTRKRIRVALEYYQKGDTWFQCVFTENTFLSEPQESPFLDEDGEPCCPIVLVSANVDRDNNRYGEVRSFISMQDEINHRRSKFLHQLSTRQTFSRQGSGPEDVAALKRELKKPDGHISFPGGEEFGKDFGILPTGDMAEAQFMLLQESKQELDAVSVNAQLSGERQQGDLSGKAIQKLQSAGTLELNRQFNLLTNWERRVYRQIWGRVKQFWNEEKWVRVTDDQTSLRWVGLNAEVTARDWLTEQVQDESLDIQTRRQAAASLQFLTQAAQGPPPQLIAAAQSGDPQALQAVQQAIQLQPVAQAALDEIVAVQNPVPEIDVDIIIDMAFHTVNIEQEQFEMLAQFGVGQNIDVIELIEISQIRGKEALIEKIEKRRAAAAEAAGNIQQLQAQDMQAKTAKTLAETKVKGEEATQKRVETILLTMQPKDTEPQVVV